MLWAKTDSDESATATYELAAEGNITVHRFNLAQGEKTETLSPSEGKVTLPLTGMPLAVVVL